MAWSFVLSLVALAGATATDLPDHVLRLARVKAKVQESLRSMPDYTCLAVTERLRQGPKDSTPRPVDVIRMEVAHAEGRDLYAWPGASRFETSENASELIGSGMSSSGEFASHLATIFGGFAVMTYAGEENRSGRRTWRWDYRLAPFASGWTVTYASRSAVAGAIGSFWVDENLEVVRIEVRTDGLPPRFPITEAATTIDYARMRVGPREVLLPQSASTIEIEDFSGEHNYNYIEFSHCRQYVTQSDVTYGVEATTAPDSGNSRGGLKEIVIPPHLRVTISLAAAIDSKRAAVGDPIEAVTTADVFEKKRLVIPEGAALLGRLRRMNAAAGPPEHFTVGLEFTDLEFPGYHARFLGSLKRVDSTVPGLRWLVSSVSVKNTVHGTFTSGYIDYLPEIPGVGTFFMEGSSFRLPEGMTMTWITEDIAKK